MFVSAFKYHPSNSGLGAWVAAGAANNFLRPGRVASIYKILPMNIYRLLLALLVVSPLAQAETLRLVIPEYLPYTSMVGGTPHGIGVDRVVPLLASLGLTCQITGGTFEQALQATKAGEADGFFMVTKNKERDQAAVFFAPIFYNNWTWYFSADSKLDPKDPNFSNSVIVGAISGSAPAGWLSQHDFHTKLTTGIDELPALLAGHKGISAILATDLVVNEAIKKSGIPADKFRAVLAERKPFGLYLSKNWVNKNPELAANLTAAIAKLQP